MRARTDDNGFDGGRFGAAAGATVAALILLGMVLLVAMSNRARDAALERERHAYDVTLLVRTVDATIARSEAALGRFVLDEDLQSSGSIYINEWRLAGTQLRQLERLVRNDPDQKQRVATARSLYDRQGENLGRVAQAAAGARGEGGIGLFYSFTREEQDAPKPLGSQLRAKLSEIASSERAVLRSSMEQTQFFSAQADRLTDYLSWLGVLIGLAAIGLGILALQAVRQNFIARREADTLEQAVAMRTQELSAANEALLAEAEEREAAESQLRQIQKMEAVGQLTGGIAHDFNNMLAVVVGGIDLARRRLGGPKREVMQHLNNAMDGATRAAALTRRLLSFARAEPLLPERVLPTDLVRGLTDLLDRTLGERITVNVDTSGEWPIFVDPHQLENALLNLAVNGRDAMEGEGVITIATSDIPLTDGEVGDLPAGDYIRIAVADTGSGMSEEVQRRAFEPFFTTKEVGKGTGLGLSQIFGFARQSGGEVAIDSAVGVGTVVSLYLPRCHAQPAEVRLHPTFSGQFNSEMAAGHRGARILLVEDDPRVRSATIEALEDLDYEPLACANAEEALAAFESQVFDLVISDVIMPGMTGPELVRNLKRRYPELGVLFVTGYVGDGEGEDLKGHELLRKPFTVAALQDAVAAALGRAEVRAA
ncbi:signal transduction histidine kinase [Sphingomonas kaistensis]|uniref:histidine kinase n=1 Tax=Sphingomonas kaistensis TaxID=298708 RepID=A0A7X5Y505_9SPHN|nr:response regulator [Sphingomonas kaistensis]NJC05308.1 signal transduction histidine kinase [Sphingomonas kaistensis]